MIRHAKAEQMSQANEQKILPHFAVCLFQVGGSWNIAAQSISQNFLDALC
jgi:hypothetical protein